MPNAPSVLSTISRASLGIAKSSPFNKGTHLKEDKFFDEDEQRYFAANQMDWYIRKVWTDYRPLNLHTCILTHTGHQGEDVAKSHPIRKDYYRTYTKKDKFPPSSLDIKIYQNQSANPPTRLTDSVTEHSTLHFNLSDLEYDDLEDLYRSDGRKVKKFDYTIQIVPSGGSTEFTIYFQGEEVGSDRVNIQFD